MLEATGMLTVLKLTSKGYKKNKTLRLSKKKIKVVFLPKIVKVHFTGATRQDRFYMTNQLQLNTHLHTHASETG